MPVKTRKNIALLLLLFLASNLLLKVDGGGNPASRLAALAAMSEEKHLNIDSYVNQIEVTKNWTADWSRAPSGKHYSNKAPGPVLLSFPLYYVWDRLFFREETPELRNHARIENIEWSGYIMSLATQVVPMALLLLFLSWVLFSKGYSDESIYWLWFLLGFANTNALLMNTFFGHGITAVFVLAACSCTLFSGGNRNMVAAGFFWGLALLCDYSVALAAPLVILSLLSTSSWKESSRKALLLCLGGLVPGLLWTYYHMEAFGSPFLIALHFQNPVFANTSSEQISLSKVIGWVPDFSVLLRLVKGSARGLLFTQPWVLGLVAYLVIHFRFFKKHPHHLFLLGSLLFFIANLWMNAAFPNWWAGASPGPRYLGPSLLPLALSLVLLFDTCTIAVKKAFCFLVFPSLILYALVMSQSVLIDNTPLWRDLAFRLVGRGPYSNFDVVTLFKFFTFVFVLMALYWQLLLRKFRNN